MVNSTVPPVIAALDLGSNTFRLALAENKNGLPVNKRVFQHVPRLSEHLQSGGSFTPAALNRAWEALDDLADKINEAGANKVLAGATMAARLAVDGPQLMLALKKRYGWEAVILTDREEARLTASGVLSGFVTPPSQSLIFDIGGRSTEFIQAHGNDISKSLSLPMGVTALTEAHLNDPLQPGDLKAVVTEVRELIACAELDEMTTETILIGTAGTVTTLAALILGLNEYQPELINGQKISRAEVVELLSSLTKKTVAERVSRLGLHPRRADVIVAGAVVVVEIMDHLGREELFVSDNGLLEGLWLWAERFWLLEIESCLPLENAEK